MSRFLILETLKDVRKGEDDILADIAYMALEIHEYRPISKLRPLVVTSYEAAYSAYSYAKQSSHSNKGCSAAEGDPLAVLIGVLKEIRLLCIYISFRGYIMATIMGYIGFWESNRIQKLQAMLKAMIIHDFWPQGQKRFDPQKKIEEMKLQAAGMLENDVIERESPCPHHTSTPATAPSFPSAGIPTSARGPSPTELSNIKDLAESTSMPFMREVARCVLEIVEAVKSVKTNKEEFQHLAGHACKTLFAMQRATVVSRRSIWSKDSEILRCTISEINKFASSRKNPFLRSKYPKSDEQRILDFTKTLDHALDSLSNLQSSDIGSPEPLPDIHINTERYHPPNTGNTPPQAPAASSSHGPDPKSQLAVPTNWNKIFNGTNITFNNYGTCTLNNGQGDQVNDNRSPPKELW